MKPRLSEQVAAIGSPRVLVIGDLILDRYAWGETSRISPEAPIPVLNLKQEESRPGGAANVASVLAHLGATVSCCGVVGDDGPGRSLRDMLTAICKGGVHVVADRARPTTVKTRFIGYVQSARRAMHHILRVDSEDTATISPAVEEELLRFLVAAIPGQDVVLVSDYEKGLLTDRLMREVIKQARAVGVSVLADPKLGRPPEFYAGVTLLTPNRYETSVLTGVTIGDHASMERAARQLVPAVAESAVLITLDRDGMYLYEAGGRGTHIRTQPREVYDVTGAGDVVVSVVALTRAAGFSWRDAAEVANIAAGIEVGKVGAAPVSRAEILAELRLQEGLPSSKIKDEKELCEILREHRRRNERIVFTNGCFDLLHIGHIELIKRARREGDVLVVGLNSDASVRALKGPTRPIIGQNERARILAALEDVTYIVLFDDPSVQRLVEVVQPDVLVKGADYEPEGVVGAEFVKSRGGRVVLAPLVEGKSTSNIVSRILEAHGRQTDQKSGRGMSGEKCGHEEQRHHE